MIQPSCYSPDALDESNVLLSIRSRQHVNSRFLSPYQHYAVGWNSGPML